MVDDPLDPIVSDMGYQAFAGANTSTTWQRMNDQTKCDLVTLDNGLNESYIKPLDKGKQLTLNDNTFISQNRTSRNPTDFSINISRSLTRLTPIVVSLSKDYTTKSR